MFSIFKRKKTDTQKDIRTYLPSPTRSEKVVFGIKLTKKDYDDNKRIIDAITTSILPSDIYGGNTLEITYTINIEYFGEVALKLSKIIELIERGVVVNFDATELLLGNSLILDVGKQLEILKTKV